MFGSLKIPIEIGFYQACVCFILAILSYLVLRKASLGRLKFPHNGHWNYNIFLVKSVQLVKNVYEGGTSLSLFERLREWGAG